MTDGIQLVHDSDGVVESWTLVLDDSNGTHMFQVDPGQLDEALRGWRMHMLEGEVVRRERERAGVSLREYRCVDPEGDWVEMQRELADHLKKRYLENRDPGDESRAA